VGTRSTITEELSRLSAAIADAWDVPLLRAQPIRTSAALLAFLEGSDRPGVLVLDEFSFLVESDPALPGLIQASWDRRLSRSELKLVFCGSSVGIMEETFFSNRAPLFGRRTGQLRLGPLPVGSLRQAVSWKPQEVVELAALFGAVPGYLQRLEPSRNLLTNLRQQVLRRGEPLYEEVPFLLREELREPRVYYAILAAVAAGARKFGEISSKVGLDRANLSRYLSVLADLGLLEREVPVTERLPEKSRKGVYRISDPFIATWFHFVHPYRDALERGRIDEVVDRFVKPRLGAYLSHAVEPVLASLLREAPASELVPFPAAFVGRHWSPKSELDVVLLDAERRRALITEIKWTRGKVDKGLLGDLRRRVQADPAFAGVDCTYALISRGGFRGERKVRSDERLIPVSRLLP
jgi:AAA+ ATPase superfamily predicted ATPase